MDHPGIIYDTCYVIPHHKTNYRTNNITKSRFSLNVSPHLSRSGMQGVQTSELTGNWTPL